MKHWSKIGKHLALLTQLGLSLAMPLLMCLLGCYLLNVRFGWGLWVYLPGFVFGLGGSAMSGYKFYLMVMKDQEKEDQAKGKKRGDGVFFNQHR